MEPALLSTTTELRSLDMQSMRRASGYENLLELFEAISKGFIDVFVSAQEGSFICLSNNKYYSSQELNITTKTCISSNAVLYLITINDGLYRGTAVQYNKFVNEFSNHKNLHYEINQLQKSKPAR